MATFLEQSLKYTIQGPYVMFVVTAKLKFQPNEIGTNWRLETTILEKDLFNPDDVFQDQNWARTFYARREIISLDIHIPILKRDLNTEPGTEEVYAKLKVVPLDGTFPASEATTNKIHVSV